MTCDGMDSVESTLYIQSPSYRSANVAKNKLDVRSFNRDSSLKSESKSKKKKKLNVPFTVMRVFTKFLLRLMYVFVQKLSCD